MSGNSDAPYDDAGDVIMLDIEDPTTIEAITADLNKSRSKVISRKIQAFDRLRQILPPDIAGLFIVDTNFAISHLSIVRRLVDAYQSSKTLVMVPWVVIQELDGLKSASNDYGQANLASLARNASRYIYDSLASSVIGLRGQKISECLSKNEFGDDAILDCALYWGQKQDIQSALLSNDRNLCSKFMIHGMKSISYKANLSAQEIIDETQNSWNRRDEAPDRDVRDDGETSTPMILDEDAYGEDAYGCTGGSEEKILTTSSDLPLEMDTDVVIAPLYNPKSNKPDLFDELSRKAGAGKYERTSHPDITQVQSSDRLSAISSKDRSLSPEAPRERNCLKTRSHVAQSDSAQISPRTGIFAGLSRQEILVDVEQTLVSALPSLIRKQLQRELSDEDSVNFLLSNHMTSIDEITKALTTNWYVSFGQLFPQYKKQGSAAIQTLSNELRSLTQSRTSSQQRAISVVRDWSDIWQALGSHSVIDRKYKTRQDRRISAWLEALEDS